MSDKAQTVRIFISSPGDVEEERRKARMVIEDLQREYAGRVHLEPVLWEELPLSVTASFQEGIEVILHTRPIDIAVFILWSRLGTPLGPRVSRPDGSPYQSGTEREFDLMLAAYEQSDHQRPHILAYVREDENWRRRLVAGPEESLPDLVEQQRLVTKFIREQFTDAQQRNIRAYHTYREPIGFAEHLATHLRGKINELLRIHAAAPLWKDRPYRGLQVFDKRHAPIFFGREEETCELLDRLRQLLDDAEQRYQHGDAPAAGTPCAFVLLVGASGSGKSSLARAGVAARLERGSYDGHTWRTATFLPGQHSGNLLGGLMSELAKGVPELRSMSVSLADVASELQRGPATAVKLVLAPALARVLDQDVQEFEDQSAPVNGNLRVLLILDQLEELWTDTNVTDEVRQKFLAAVEALARCGRVAVLATLRSDFYPQSQASLLPLKGDWGHCDLLPPGPAALQRLITEPAWLAGLQFERDEASGRTLDQLLIDDALRDPAALPLLQYALDELHRSCPPDQPQLGFAAYNALGGMEGALGKRAAEVFAALPADVQQQLEGLLPLLVTVQTGGSQSVVRRWAALDQLRATPQRSALTDALVEARFLTTDKLSVTSIHADDDNPKGGSNQENHSREIPVATLAHEALLSRWDKVAQWVERNRDTLRMRAAVEQSQQRWEEAGSDNSLLLPRGLALEEGKQLLDKPAELVSDSTREYIHTSVAHDRALRNRRRLIVATVTPLIAVGAFLAYHESRARNVTTNLLAAEPSDVTRFREQLSSYSSYGWYADMLLADVAGSELTPEGDAAASNEEEREKAKNRRKRQLHAQIGMVERHREEFCDQLRARILEHEPPLETYEYIRVIGDALQAADDSEFPDALWTTFQNGQGSTERFRAGLALACYDDTSWKWNDEQLCRFMTDQLVGTNPVYFQTLTSLLDPIAVKRLNRPLQDVFRDEDRRDTERVSAANALATFNAKNPTLLAQLLCDATPGQYAALYPALEVAVDDAALRRLEEIVSQLPGEELDPEGRVKLGKRRAGAAITLLRQGKRQEIFPALRVTDDPESLTQFVHRCKERGVTPAELLDCLNVADDSRQGKTGEERQLEDRVLFGILLALGEFTLEELELNESEQKRLINQLAVWYGRDPGQEDPSSAIHGATGWLLRHWQQEEITRKVAQTEFPYLTNRQWFTRKIEARGQVTYMTFVVIQHEEREYEIGSPLDEPDHESDETRHKVRFTYSIAILDREVTWAEAAMFDAEEGEFWRKQTRLQSQWAPENDHPWVTPRWYDAVCFCRWLTRQVGLGEEEQAYGDPESQENKVKEEYQPDPNPAAEGAPLNWPLLGLDRHAFRVPTESEWEVACRAGTRTAWSCGGDASLLNQYGWFMDNSDKQTHGVRLKRPNLFGLFDMHGNVYEWCHDWFGPFSEDEVLNPEGPPTGRGRIRRGGGWSVPARYCRSASRNGNYPSYRDNFLGFRLALVPSSQEEKNGGDKAESDSRQAEPAEAEPTR